MGGLRAQIACVRHRRLRVKVVVIVDDLARKLPLDGPMLWQRCASWIVDYLWFYVPGTTPQPMPGSRHIKQLRRRRTGAIATAKRLAALAYPNQARMN